MRRSGARHLDGKPAALTVLARPKGLLHKDYGGIIAGNPTVELTRAVSDEAYATACCRVGSRKREHSGKREVGLYRLGTGGTASLSAYGIKEIRSDRAYAPPSEETLVSEAQVTGPPEPPMRVLVPSRFRRWLLSWCLGRHKELSTTGSGMGLDRRIGRRAREGLQRGRPSDGHPFLGSRMLPPLEG